MQKLEIPNRGYIPREKEIDTIFTIVNDNMFTVVYRDIEYKVSRFADVCEISAVIDGVTWIAERSYGFLDFILKFKKTCGKISMSWQLMDLLEKFGVMQTPVTLPAPNPAPLPSEAPAVAGNPSYVASVTSPATSDPLLYDYSCTDQWHTFKTKFQKLIEKIPIANDGSYWRAVA